MKKDLTYIIIDCEKTNIAEFIENLKTISRKKGMVLSQADCSFFALIAKHIIFYKYFYYSSLTEIEKGYIKTIISDLYYLVLSIMDKEKRYIYVNVRSIIENNIRLVTTISLEDNFITFVAFEKLKEMKYRMTDDEYSLIRNEYRVACNYVHGGKLLEDNLSFVFEECFIKPQMSDKEKNAFYKRIGDILKIFDKFVIAQYTDIVNGCFHRSKSLLSYLIGNDNVDLLFLYMQNCNDN